MEKKTINVHSFSIHLYAFLIILLFALIAVLGLKYAHLKMAVKGYTASTIWMNSQNQPNGNISDYGKIIALGISEFVPSKDLQDYVSALSTDLDRDLIVINNDKKILADSNPKDVGLIYNYDSKGEIKMSISDGQSRVFTETSESNPGGITQVVVPMKNADGKVIGAVIISNATLGK